MNNTHSWEKIENPKNGEVGKYLEVANAEQHWQNIWSTDDRNPAEVIGKWDFDNQVAEWLK